MVASFPILYGANYAQFRGAMHPAASHSDTSEEGVILGPGGGTNASLLAPPRARETTQSRSTSSYKMHLCRSRLALVLPYSIVPPSRPSLPPSLKTDDGVATRLAQHR